MKQKRILPTFTFLVVLGSLLAGAFAGEPMARYNVVWDSPSKDVTGQMPLGNGDIAAGVYAIEDGDLYLLLAKNDAFNYNGDIYKTGLVRISLTTNPFAKGKPFRQTLDLPTGSIFSVGDRSVFPTEMEYCDVEPMISQYPDPYRWNTFGNLLESPQLALKDGTLNGKGESFDIRIHALTKQTPEISEWIDAIELQAARPVDMQEDWAAHGRWWSAFWNRSWIIASDNSLPPEEREKFNGEAPSGRRVEEDGGALVAQSYNLSLRVIIGPHQEDFPHVLQPGVWQHIAVVIRRGHLAVYLDGEKL